MSCFLQSSSFVQFLHSHLFHTHNFTTFTHRIIQNTLTSNTQASIPVRERNCKQGLNAALIIHLQNLGVNANVSQLVQAVLSWLAFSVDSFNILTKSKTAVYDSTQIFTLLHSSTILSSISRYGTEGGLFRKSISFWFLIHSGPGSVVYTKYKIFVLH